MFDVCVVGSSNLDLVVTTPRHPAPGETVLGVAYHEYAGGKGLNQVVAAARAGARCAFVTALGDDAAADQLESVLTGEHIDLASLQRVPGTPSGRALITVDDAGENSIVVVAGANGALSAAPPPGAKVVLAQLEIPSDVLTTALRHASAAGAVTILNPAPSADLPDELLRCCTIVIPNEHERDHLGGAARLFDLGAEMVITTLGGDGVDIETPDRRQHVPPFQVHPVDTTGAGDAFCGAFAAAIASGSNRIDAVTFAAAAGALATTKSGAVPSLPRRADIDSLLRR